MKSTEISSFDNLASGEPAEDRFLSTSSDIEGMTRMGHSRQLVRRYRVFSMVAFVVVSLAAWQLVIFQITLGLVNGGISNLMLSSIWCSVGAGPVALSMAEMASMAPTAGAQYHWVSEFAPEKYQKLLSYITGWASIISWQAGNVSGALLVGTLIQVVIQLGDAGYDSPHWHATLITVFVLLLACVANVYAARLLRYWQTTAFVTSLLVYLTFIIPIWVEIPRVSSARVWTQFEHLDGGWPNLALAVLIGQQPALTWHSGLDAATHMAEEVQDASHSVPRVIILTYLINSCLSVVTIATLCYHMPDVSAALADSSTYPAIWVLRKALSDTWLMVLLIAIIASVLASNMSYLAAVSRDLFAFARDRGLPFSVWTARIDAKRRIPVNAYIATAFIGTAMSLIYLGSYVAFYAIITLYAVALQQCFCLSIGCILWRRIHYPETLPPAKFSLGRYGILLNSLALIFDIWSVFWCFWPIEYPVTAVNMNWSAPIFVGVLLFATVYYTVVGRKYYISPVARIRRHYNEGVEQQDEVKMPSDGKLLGLGLGLA